MQVWRVYRIFGALYIGQMNTLHIHIHSSTFDNFKVTIWRDE